MRKLIFTTSFLLFFLLLQGQEVVNRPEIYCKHFFYGYPWGTPVTNDLIIRDIYALSNNDETKFADWVAYRLDTIIISGPERTRNWKADPWLAENETLEPYSVDYEGAYDALGTDRGHQAPLATFDGSDVWYEVNYFSNITPQKSNLNRGTWMRLESKVRKLVESVEDYVYVMTGPLYERDMPTLPNADESHKIPSGYWKIVCYEDKSGYINTTAFIFDQNTERSSKIQTHAVTIDEVEAHSGLDFLWLLPDDKEAIIESTINQAWISKFFTE